MKCNSTCPNMVLSDDEIECQQEDMHDGRCYHKTDFWILYWEKDGMALRPLNSGITLKGWFCKNPRCGVFNGEEKEIRTECRCCGSAK